VKDMQQASTGFENIPDLAVHAWQSVGNKNSRPSAITALFARDGMSKKRKSMVFRLHGSGPGGTDIVAKCCQPDTGRIEQVIYEKILPKIPVATLNYYGSVLERDAHWIFTGYAEGERWNSRNKLQSERIAAWFGTLHAYSVGLDALSLLPDKGVEYYKSQLSEASRRTQDTLSKRRFTGLEISALEEIVHYEDLLKPHWSRMSSFCELNIPSTLIHNDIFPKNVHTRNSGLELEIVPFDWEMSGRGHPAVDLFCIVNEGHPDTLDCYWRSISEHFEGIRRVDIEFMCTLGGIFRAADALEWASQSFIYGSGRSMMKANYFVNQIKNCMKYFSEK
jgi:thiamine kinase-like enzyme